MISDNINAVTSKITKRCDKLGRPADSVKLICVTKEADVSQIEDALVCGIRNLGENRVQDLISKYKAIGDAATWHLIGHLQTNKVKDAVRISTLIHSVDSLRLLREINNQAARIGKVQGLLIQVNTSLEATKFGIKPEEVKGFLNESLLYTNIDIKGLMTIAPEYDDPEKARPWFRVLRELRDEMNSLQILRFQLKELSMGMSNDFEIAIDEGATMVRVGRAIFT